MGGMDRIVFVASATSDWIIIMFHTSQLNHRASVV